MLRAGQLICRTDIEKELYMMQTFGGMDQSRCEITLTLSYNVDLMMLQG